MTDDNGAQDGASPSRPGRDPSSRVEGLRRQILADPGPVSKHLIEIDALLKWQQLDAAFQPPRFRRRWPMPTLLVLTMILTSLVFFVRIPSAAVDLEVAVSEFSFVTSARHDLTFPKLLKTFTITGASSIEGTLCAGAPETLNEIWIGVTGMPGAEAAITPGHAELSAGTEVVALHSGRLSRYQINVGRTRQPDADTRDVSVSFAGPVRVRSGAACNYESKTLVPSSFIVHLNAYDENSFTMEPSEGQLAEPIDIPIQRLSLAKVDQNLGARSYVRSLSNVLSGDLYVQPANTGRHVLRSGEHVAFDNPEGVIHVMSSAPDRLNIRFTANVKGVDLGAGDNRRSVMPTLFDWLTANHGLSTMWATGLYAFGFVVAVYRWWTKAA